MSLTVHNIPHDVILEVFQYFSQPFRLSLWHEFPWFLGHICSEWRQIFLSMIPEFWSEIELNWKPMFFSGAIVQYYFQRRNLFKELVAFFLSRGSGHPFSFQFLFQNTPRKNWCSDWDFILHIFTKLIEQSMRWHDVLIEGPDALIFQLASVRNRIPLLKRLALSHVSTPPNTCYQRSFENAPCLTHLTLSDVSTWNFQWATLTSFSFVSKMDDLTYFFHVLSQMKNLEELKANGLAKLDQRSNTVIVFPHLIRLTVYNVRWLKYFEAPSLQHLTIGSRVNLTTHHSTIVNFLRRSRCPFLRLDVYNCSIPMLMEILQHAPTIVQLGMTFMKDLVGILRCLTPKEEHNSICALPRLQTLRIHILHLLEEEEVEMICSLVTSRGRGVEAKWGRRLQTLRIESFGDYFREARSWHRISEVCEGFNVELVTAEV